MKRYLLTMAMTLLTAATTLAADADTYRLAEELLDLMNIKANIEKSFDMVKKMIPAHARQHGDGAGEAADTTPAESIMDMIKAEMSWDSLKDDYIAVYAETFTAQELQGLVDFYKTPVGQSFIAKQPELMRRSMEISQRQMSELMPRIRELSRPTPAVRTPMPAMPSE